MAIATCSAPVCRWTNWPECQRLSGGARPPESGAVLGILNMVFVKGTKESALTNPSGISYAIPVSFLKALIGP